MRKSTRYVTVDKIEEKPEVESTPPTDEEEECEDDFQFGIWLRHRRIDGALNRVPNNFYAVWLRLFRFPSVDVVAV